MIIAILSTIIFLKNIDNIKGVRLYGKKWEMLSFLAISFCNKGVLFYLLIRLYA